MTSAFTVVLVTFGLLSLVTARPTVIHQKNVDEQGYTALKFLPQQMQADAASVSYLKQLQPLYPANQQEIIFGLPQQQSAEKQGSISWRWAQQQAPQNAKEEGITFRLPQQESAEKQRITWNWAQQQAPQYAKEEGITFRLPQQESAEKQSITWNWAQQQAPQYAKEEGITFRLPQRESAEKQRITWNWAQQQAPQYTKGEGTYPYNRHTQQAKGQSITMELPHYAKQEGITFTYPQNQQSKAKEQGFTMRLPQLALQGIRIPFGKEQGITFSYPQIQRAVYGSPYLGGSWFSQQKSSNANEQGSVTVSWRQQLNKLNAAIQGALCSASAAYDAGKLAEVAAYAKMDEDTLGDLLKQFGKKLCDKDTNDTETE